MQCPNCSVQLTMSERQGIEIDYCPNCRGVWLDRGELDKIIERSQTTSIPQSARQDSHPESRSRDNYYGKRKRKKSFFEELFD